VARDGAWDEVIALAERHEAPVWTAPMSARNSFPEDHRLLQGFLVASREKIVAALQGHDLVLVLGAPAFTYHVEGAGPHVPEGARLFQLVDDPAQAAWLPGGLAVVTSLKSGIADLLDGPSPASRTAPAPRANPAPLDPAILRDTWLLDRIAALRPGNGVIVEEAPSSREPMHDWLPITRPDGFYTCASGGLGHGLPASIGVALARPDARVIALLGDGSAMYAIQGLWTAAQLGLPMTFIIINNRRYEALLNFGRHFGLQRTVGTELGGIDFVQVAQGQGLEARRVEATEGLDEALRWAFGSTGPVLLEVLVD
jgi:benzoylformate decarboxylase